MKKSMLLFAASILSVSLAWAQPAQVQVDIHLSTNSSTAQGAPINGYQILLWDLDATGGRGTSFYTDANGDVSVLYTSIHTSGSGHFKYIVKDCQNVEVANRTVYYTTQGAQVVLVDSVLVPCVDPCNVFGSVNNNGNKYSFYANAGNSQRWDMKNAQWDFSDGTSFTGRNTVKQFPLGTHSWTLTHQGCAVDSGLINVTGTCSASFSVDTASSGGGTVNMFNTSTSTSPNNTTYFFWDFGDGTTSNLAFPQHQYSGNGPYSIYLSMIEVNTLGDTICHSTYGDTLGIDSLGNIFKNGFSINVMDPSSLGITDQEEVAFSIFPQPASEVIRIESSTALNRAELIDLNGRLVQEWTLDNGTHFELQLEKHPSGMYALRLHSAKGVSNKKCLIK